MEIMTDIYLCSSFKNSSLNRSLVVFLESIGYKVYSPERDTNQMDKDGTFKENINGIRKSKLVLVVLENYYGKDLTWEVGYSFALKKPIIVFYSKPPKREVDDVMLKGCISSKTIGKEQLLNAINLFLS